MRPIRKGVSLTHNPGYDVAMSGTEPTAAGSPFWRFSLQFYRRPGVAEACIALQEDSGVDVNLLLFLLWHAMQGRVLSGPEIESLEGRIAPWRQQTVVPLRVIRRALKSPPALVEAGTAEAFRTRIKAVELEAERLQQEAMYALVQAGLLGKEASAPAEAARHSVDAYESSCLAPFAKPAVEKLLDALVHSA
jgi:uncharacterized protein (TIGR02444 family)